MKKEHSGEEIEEKELTEKQSEFSAKTQSIIEKKRNNGPLIADFFGKDSNFALKILAGYFINGLI